MKTGVSQCRAKEGQDDHTDGSTDTGSQVCCKEGLTRSLSDSCHRISVKGCHDSRAVSRNVEKDGREGSSIHVGVVESSKKDDGCSWVKLIGQRQKECYSSKASDTRHCTYYKAKEGTKKTSSNILECEYYLESMKK